MDFLELAEKRYSCRKFSDKKVEPEKLDQILKAALVAPTAHNMQPVKLWVLQSDEAIEKINKTTTCIFGCTTVIAVGAKADIGWVRDSDNRPFADVDAAILGTHIMMETYEQGLATTWVGWFNEPMAKELFPEFKDYDMVALFPIGYAAENAHPSKLHTQRKPKEEMVEYL